MMFQSMGCLELVPFIMVYIAILIQINGLEYFLICILKMGGKFLPVHKIIPVGIHIAEVSVKGLGIRHSHVVMLLAA